MTTIKWKDLPSSFLVTVGLLLFLILLSLCSNWLAPYDPYATNPLLTTAPPSAEHWFGTDIHGRDVLSRIIVGSKTSIFASFALIVLATTIGTCIGLIGGYCGGRIDAWLMRVTDVFLAFPDLILAIAVAGFLGGGLINSMIALLATTWTQYARLARSAVMAVKTEPYIYAARISGCTQSQIIFKHILPNIFGPILITATLHISKMMMGLAGLSFLGLGVKVPEAEWGTMISDGFQCLQIAPWVALLPSLVMVMVMMLFNLFGDQVRDLLDPKSKL